MTQPCQFHHSRFTLEIYSTFIYIERFCDSAVAFYEVNDYDRHVRAGE
jgi:hypothetical protein